MLRYIAICLLLPVKTFAQTVDTFETVSLADKAKMKQVYTYVDRMPEADYDVYAYLGKNIKYPLKAKKEKIIGKVAIRFIVDTDGEITEATVIKSAHPLLDAEALRVVSTFPKWKPGKQDGKSVKVFYTLPISFKIEESENPFKKKKRSKPD